MGYMFGYQAEVDGSEGDGLVASMMKEENGYYRLSRKIAQKIKNFGRMKKEMH